MRILLASNAQYFPAHGGGERSNRMLMEALAERGHECVVITRSERFGVDRAERLIAELTERGVRADCELEGVQFQLNRVAVVTGTNPVSFRRFFVRHKDAFAPDVIITSTDDPAQLLLNSSLEDRAAATVFLARATIALPFGDDAAFQSRDKTEVLRRVDGVVGVSNYVAQYIAKHSGIAALHLPIALPEVGPHPELGRFENEFVTLANPCAVKGLSIFTGLAQALRTVAFAGVPTWGTTADDVRLMEAEPNIRIVPKVDRINDLLAKTRVLLVPSLWAEARSRIVVEAMLAGVPVIASDWGGLPEAKMGVPYILPVNPVRSYTKQLNEQMVPVADVPEQNLGPWRETLERLTTDAAHWREISRASRTAALHYAETTTIEPFESFLLRLKRGTRETAPTSFPAPDRAALLSSQRRKLLDIRLHRQGAVKSRKAAMPFEADGYQGPRLLCFPHAGGGTAFFRTWKTRLAGTTPVQYPGHEARRTEAFATSMTELVNRMAEELQAVLTGDFAFFGHSMGAIVAFELTRALIAAGRESPKLLIASAARAPIYRLNHVAPADPDRSALLEQVRGLGGVPNELWEDERLLDAVLPSLEADAKLYRRYQYEAGPPLDIPILAIGGIDDPNVTADHLARWSEHTTGDADMRMFAGGHFFLRQSEETVLAEVETAFARVLEKR